MEIKAIEHKEMAIKIVAEHYGCSQTQTTGNRLNAHQWAVVE
jgi:hypothetical protein